MPMLTEAIVAGPYTITYNSVALGIFEGDEGVPSIEQTQFEQPVNSTDRYGRTKIDAVWMGNQYVFQGILMEYAKALAALDPVGTFGSSIGSAGVLKQTLAKALVLTAVSGTSAATAPATLTANRAVPAADFNAKLAFGPQYRKAPIKLDLLPYDVGAGAVGFFVKT